MRHIPLTAEPWSQFGPLEAAARLHGRPYLAWLDSALASSARGRWSIVASDPRWIMLAHGSRVSVRDKAGLHCFTADPLRAFASRVEAEVPRVLDPTAPALPFVGGAIGYLGFELGRFVERLPATTIDDVGVPDLAMAWYDAALVWDGLEATGWLVGTPESVCALKARLCRLRRQTEPNHRPSTACDLRSNFSRPRYLDAVRRARAYIEAGDIYQVNLSQRFSAPVHAGGLDLYTRLREVSPAPFAAYLDFRPVPGDPDAHGLEVLSSSPERLLLLDGDRLETRPIKGTRRRGATPADDAYQAEALLASRKDAAEHVMIVDLERNDLGRIADVGSVSVEELAGLETFAQVHHLTSTVTARRRPDVGLEATLRAVFPGGSISGAPKIRALEIIDELEPTVRGVYTGAIGYVSAHGRADLNIAIRTITLSEGVAHLHVGGAIVADSDPAAEYQETLDKARGMARALGVRLPDEPDSVADTADA
ncbi:MAG: aminodeoxychorismate synthase component I [Dehalococcoidia bacterium]